MGEAADFLYPFIDARETDAGALLVDLAGSAQAKAVESERLLASTLAESGRMLDDAARDVAVRVTSGAHLFVFGNGGSSTDAAGLATLFADPPLGRPVAAHCLAEDPAVVTALANDVGYELVFTRQLIAHARPGDVAIGLSTSGSSRNVMLAFAHARAHELLTIGIAGYEGGEMASSDDVARCIVVRSDSVHRIQETQAAIGCALWSRVQEQLSELAARGASE